MAHLPPDVFSTCHIETHFNLKVAVNRITMGSLGTKITRGSQHQVKESGRVNEQKFTRARCSNQKQID